MSCDRIWPEAQKHDGLEYGYQKIQRSAVHARIEQHLHREGMLHYQIPGIFAVAAAYMMEAVAQACHEVVAFHGGMASIGSMQQQRPLGAELREAYHIGGEEQGDPLISMVSCHCLR